MARVMRARVTGGRLMLDEPTDLPEGTEVELVVVPPSERGAGPFGRSERTPSGRFVAAPAPSERSPSGRFVAAPAPSERSPSGRAPAAPTPSERTPSTRFLDAPATPEDEPPASIGADDIIEQARRQTGG
jgi:hypothetical protein